MWEAVQAGKDFKYQNIHQITARFAGKTVAGTIAIIKALIAAKRAKRRIVVYQFRNRHKDISKLWEENLTWLNDFQIPYYTRKSEGLIVVLGSKLFIKGCYVTNSSQIAMIGTHGNYQFSHAVLIFEEAVEFEKKTILAVLEAIRGSQFKTVIYRCNPWLASNWFISQCFSQVGLDEPTMLSGSGNQWVEKGKDVYHYARWTNQNLKLLRELYEANEPNSIFNSYVFKAKWWTSENYSYPNLEIISEPEPEPDRQYTVSLVGTIVMVLFLIFAVLSLPLLHSIFRIVRKIKQSK